ncbi:hypothetical protein QJ48_14025 [Paenibacillus sp. A3]|uniref:hypothetical protein n=1 Tax=Paenibacillus sp. A3 TaxID=1337054 RepID=UPI0006D53F17|nr:hypothetical protein [Paenibacillus sp. A3]KPV58903.1 hypothetical protein QJ48_14025 [Paenibacillus sp. A3]
MSFSFQGQGLKKVFAILLSAVCFTGLGTREALAWPYQTYWDCSDNLYDCQAADLVPGLAQYAHTVHLKVPEGKVISYHYKDDGTEEPFEHSYTEIILSYLNDKGQVEQVASFNVRRGDEAGGELIAPKSNSYYLTMQCYQRGWEECSGSGYLRTLK